ncbi:MAG: hypothetical protein WCV84_05165 [Patescibacteria group bacterium]
MKNREGAFENPLAFAEQVSSELHAIHKELSSFNVLTQATLTPERIDAIADKIYVLEKLAENRHDKIRTEILKKLQVSFSSLTTVGIADNITKFGDEALHAFSLLQIALLSMGGKHGEALLAEIEEERRLYA